ncbi:putative membrane protein (plasmid) [Rhizobium favelukesii]|uniref:Membrane protein n=1 Tax=Rhizobium favelukesii TaxID=348824 RepID=W6RMI7_9HYPH|nr:putative membrane protein [Rhizobium favelukesii]
MKGRRIDERARKTTIVLFYRCMILLATFGLRWEFLGSHVEAQL